MLGREVAGTPGALRVLLLASTLTVLAGAIIAPSLPAIQQHFAAEPHAALLSKLLLTLPSLFIALTATSAGLIIDRFGPRRLLLTGLVLYALAGTSGLWLATLPGLLGGRAVLGLAVAMIMTSSTALIATLFEGPARLRALGLQSMAMSMGGIVFLSTGGFLADLGWRWPFAMYVASLVLVPLVWVLVPAVAPHAPGGSTAAAAAGPGRTPPLPWRRLAALYAVAYVGMVTFYILPVQMPFHLTQTFGVAKSVAGLSLALMTTAAASSALMFGRLRRRWSSTAMFALTAAVAGSGYVVVAGAHSLPEAWAGLAIGGFGLGMMMPNLNTSVVEAVAAPVRGRALGGLSTAVFLGQFSSPIITAPVVARGGIPGLMLVLGGGLAVVGLVMLVRHLRPCAPQAAVTMPPMPALPMD